MKALAIYVIAWFILLLYIRSLTGCVDVPNVNSTHLTVALKPAIAMVSGDVKGDSIVATLWTCDSTDVIIDNPDSLITQVRIFKKGHYTFTLWATNVWGFLDSAQQHITVK